MNVKDRYTCVPLTSNVRHLREIQEFVIDREAAYSSLPDTVSGLEAYLKRQAWQDDLDDQVKVYLIKDVKVGKIAAYFALRAGMVGDNKYGGPDVEDMIDAKIRNNAKAVDSIFPGVEISHFAVNDDYRRAVSTMNNPVRGLGKLFYPIFIHPVIEEVSKQIGIKIVYLFAADDAEDEEDQHLVGYYEKVFGFHLSDGQSLIPIQPGYDSGCAFMYMLRNKLS